MRIAIISISIIMIIVFLFSLTTASTTIPIGEEDILGNKIILGSTIVVDKSESVNIDGKIYDIQYVEKPARIKCICDIKTGCTMRECLDIGK